MDCFISHTVLLLIIALFIIRIICQHYVSHRTPQKTYCCTNNVKIENNEFYKIVIKNCTYYHLDDIIKFQDFDFANISLDEKSYEKTLIYDVLYKTYTDAKTLHIMSVEVNRFIRDYDVTKYLVLFGLETNNAICDRTRYFIGLKIGIADIFLIVFERSGNN